VDGLCGNEDAGQMSAWYNFSALGFYQVNAANGVYVIGSPEVDGATINLENGKKFELLAMNNSSKNIYIQKITWNGVSYEKSYLTHDMIMQGGKLVYFMGDKPNKSFGSKVSNRPQ
ncbi:MAG TPA: glycoside hydrolase family 92 protein, partial [Saprospiraceae bacterium]|nr:glycoside hydrolase family 92 protein [Saprospiraceae bacterium]